MYGSVCSGIEAATVAWHGLGWRPATGEPGGDFTPGMYLKLGYVITSRGCPNRCPFCRVCQREGSIRELPITEGCNVLDDNLLACSTGHVLRVVDMLRRQKMGRPQFTGGLEAKRFTPELAEAIRSVNPVQVFFAYNDEDDWEPLVRAAELCRRYRYSLKGHHVRAYVLCGYRANDTLEAAAGRMRKVLSLGIVPMAMVWRGNSGQRKPGWAVFQRRWARPAIICDTGRR